MKGQISKGLGTAILVYAIWWVLYGLLHVISPELMAAKDVAVERVLGAAVVVLGLGALLAYLDKNWDRVKLVILIQISWMVLYTITMAWGILTGGIIAAAWPPVILAVVFAVWLAILYRREERSAV